MSALMSALVARFAEIEDELNVLDAATGDGDHGSTILRGLRAAALDAADPIKAFRGATGGASGSLFAQVITAILAAESGADLAGALSAAAQKVGQIGQAKPGDKTMLDALIPASVAANDDSDPFGAAMTGALAGLETTRAMAARRGRARYVEGAGVGHLDAGARSVVECLTVLARLMGDRS
jgi:phosphoenolpyruvate---glycerone phosphotransferase subunit DhaL